MYGSVGCIGCSRQRNASERAFMRIRSPPDPCHPTAPRQPRFRRHAEHQKRPLDAGGKEYEGCALQMERPWAVSEGIRASRLYFRFQIFQATTAAMAGNCATELEGSIQERPWNGRQRYVFFFYNSVSRLKFTLNFLPANAPYFVPGSPTTDDPRPSTRPHANWIHRRSRASSSS